MGETDRIGCGARQERLEEPREHESRAVRLVHDGSCGPGPLVSTPADLNLTLPDPLPCHPACLPEADLLASVAESRYRASGPGGQHRNKVETGVRLLHRPSGIRGEANERRSLAQNRSMALRRLRLRLALDLRVEKVEAYAPSALWLARTGGPRLAVNPKHADVPALLAEALDVLAAVDDELAEAASLLGVTGSRLLRVLKLEPAALAGLNAKRQKTGRKIYR